MSNVKDVVIEARVPWDWCERLDANELVLFAPITLNPVYGLRIDQREDGFDPNEHGGQTAMYLLRIFGTEAIPSAAVIAMSQALDNVGEVLLASEYDMENHEYHRIA